MSVRVYSCVGCVCVCARVNAMGIWAPMENRWGVSLLELHVVVKHLTVLTLSLGLWKSNKPSETLGHVSSPALLLGDDIAMILKPVSLCHVLWAFILHEALF